MCPCQPVEMARKRNIKKGFEMPWQVALRCLRDRLGDSFRAWAIIKLTCGPSFTRIPEGVTRREINKLVKLKWLRKDNKTKRFYQVATDQLFEFVKGQDAVFFPAEWKGWDGDAVLYYILAKDYIKVHPTAATPMQEAERQPLKPCSEHFGGFALSEAKRLTGMSIGKAWNLRQKCTALGLCFFTNRYVSTSHDCAYHGKVIMEDPRHLFDGYRRPMARLTSKLNSVAEVEFRPFRNGRPTRHKADPRSATTGIENFSSGAGGSKACFF